jgi:hypothetical protein
VKACNEAEETDNCNHWILFQTVPPLGLNVVIIGLISKVLKQKSKKTEAF